MTRLDTLRFQKRAYLSHLTLLVNERERFEDERREEIDLDDEERRTESMIHDLDFLIKIEQANE